MVKINVMKQIGLYELMKGIRSEFKRIMDDPDIKAQPLLELEDLEIEIAVIISKAGRAGLKFVLVPLGLNGQVELSSERVSKLKIKFRQPQSSLDNTPCTTIYSSPEN